MRGLIRERGELWPLLAIVLPVVLAVAVLLVDLRRLSAFQHELQEAADSAAQTVARQTRRQSEAAAAGNPRSEAVSSFYENGAAIEIRVPSEGSYAGDGSFREVVVRKAAPMVSLRLLGREAPIIEARIVVEVPAGDAAPHEAQSDTYHARG